MNLRRFLLSLIFPVIFLSLITFTSCKHEAELPPIIPGVNDSICFDTQVLPIFQSNCAKSGCHDGSEEFALTDYSQIRSKVKPGNPNDSKLYEAMTAAQWSEEFMPPSPNQPLTNEQITTVQLWIMEGANPTSCSGGPCDSTNVTFTGTIMPIVETNCKGCHSGSSASANLQLTNYDLVKSAVQNKFLLDHILNRNGYSQMPPAGSLSTCNIAQFKKWINDGMLP